jgi:hypothetical protein
MNLFLTKKVFISEVQTCTATCFDVEGDILAIGMYVYCLNSAYLCKNPEFFDGI